MKKIFTLFAALMMAFSMSAATKTIYCKMAQSWWKADGAAVGAYYWGTGSGPAWPGVRMTPVSGETDLWSIDIDTDKFQTIIFTRVNGSGTVSDWGAKTADLTIPTDDKNLYTITSTSPVWGNPGVAGTWSVYAPDAPKTYKDITITIVANATPKIHYWEGGDKVVGTEWDTKPEMVATGEENTYSYTIKEVDEATGVKYLVVVGDVQSADQQAFENVTANFKDLLPQVAVMGVTGWTGDKMTVADDYLSASVTLTLEAAKDYELKLTVNGEWFGSNAITITKDNNSAVFAENGDRNGTITTDLAGDYVFTYIYATKTLVVTYPTPVVDDPVVELPAASVRAWAYDLALAVEGEQYTFSYKATTAAKATLIFSDAEGVELSTKDLGLVEAGANTAVLAASELPEAAEINWAIKLEAGAIAEFTELTDESKGIYNFYLPQGVAVDNNPESASFGQIYVAAATDGASDGSSERADTQKRGIFIYDQELNELNPTSNVGILPSNVTLGDATRQAMKRIVVNPLTNEVAFAHNVAPLAVWAVPAENVGGEAKNLIEGLGFTSVNALCFTEDGTLYVMESAGYPAPGSLYKVVNGVVDTIFASNTRFGNADLALVSDNRGGIWICQNRGQLDGFNQLTHVNAAGEIDFEVNSTTPNGFESKNTARGSIAYNPAEDILAMSIGTGSTIGASLFKVTYDETTGVPALTLIGSTPSMGKNVDGLAFDYAGDLYGLSANKERFYKFAVPTENNVCTTPAASKYAIKLVEEYIVKATVNPAETGVISGLAEGGVYVKGAEATLTATAAEGYEFVNWTVADSVVSTEATYTFVVEANVELVANFKEKVKAIEVNVTDATATSGEWSIDLAGSWNDQALTIKLWQDNTQGFGSYAPNTETGYYILLGAKELTPTTEGVYADNGDGTFTFTCSATEGTTQYNITVTGTSGAQEVYYETYELTNLVVTDNETFLVLSASDMNIGLAVMLGVNMDRTLMDASQILFGEEELPILSSEPVTVTFNEELQTEVYTARVVVEHMGQQLGLELIMYAGGATSEPIAVNVIGATAAVDEATDVLKITGDWDGIAFELRINAYDPAQTLYEAPQIAEFETDDVYATSSRVTVIKTGENIDVIGEFMSPMGDIYNVYVNAIFAAGPETGVDNIQFENTTVKVVEDGQVFIIRNGVKFNANGAVVK